MTFKVTGKGLAIGIAAGVGLYAYAKGEIRSALKAVNPADRENVINQGVQKVGEAVTGDDHFNLGSRLFELFNPEVVRRENEVLRGDSRITGYEPPPEKRLMRLGTSTVRKN